MTAILRRVRHQGEQAGFTLIELLVVVMLLGVVGSIVGSGLISSLRADGRTRARVATTADLTKGVDRMTKQIRVAAPLIDFSDSEISVETYRNDLRYRYTYTYDAAAKTVTETVETYASATDTSPTSTETGTLLRNVVNGETPMFAYYDRNGGEATQAKDVARVVISLVEKPTTGDVHAPIGYTTSVFLRNYQEL